MGDIAEIGTLFALIFFTGVSQTAWMLWILSKLFVKCGFGFKPELVMRICGVSLRFKFGCKFAV
ncbi:hypothetical protein HMSSN036_38740 [Paenibacillus macerans]|nr:hypothetical protein HMSSN036_38740 [Paenibacillus macerans]